MTPRQKINRYLSERSSRLWLAGLLIGMIGAGLLAVGLHAQMRQWSTIKSEFALVKRLPEMEQTLQSPEYQAKLAERRRQARGQDNFTLNGMSVYNNQTYALIDNSIYKEGDTLGDYTVVKITAKNILLENNLTKESKTLAFPNEESL